MSANERIPDIIFMSRNFSLSRVGLLRRIAALLLIPALLAVRPLPASAGELVWIGNDSGNNSDFTLSGNWQGNTLPSWGYANTLKFNQNLNSNVTGLNYNWGDWRQVNDIFWDSTFTVSRTLSQSDGGGINFKTRLENNSSFTQTVTMALSGGSDGAGGIELNPVNGDLILSGTIYNDNSVDYTVWGSQSATTTTLTLNTALGPNATQSNVDFTISGGRNSSVQVNASQLWAGTTTVNSGAFTTANGVTLASSAIVVAGGTVATSSANTFADTAALTVNSGRLSIGGDDTVASLAGSGGTVNLAAGATLTAGDAGSTSYAGSISGSGGFTKVGAGTFTLSATSSYTGTTTVSDGQFSLGASNLLADTSAVAVAGGTLALGGHSDTVGSFAISGGSLTGSGTVTASTYALSGGTLTANLGAGTMSVTGNASLNGTSGATILNLNSGTLSLGSGGRLTATTAVAVTGSTGGALTLGGNESVGSLAGSFNVNFGSATLTTGNDNSSTTYSGILSGSGGLTKAGNGTFTISGTSSYAGATAVNGGRLLIDGQLGNTAVAVNAAGLLGGSGTILGDVTVSSSGTLSPGNSPGVLTVGSLSLLAGSITVMEITGTSTSLYDQIVGTGSGGLTYGGTLDLVMSGSYADQTTFHLFSNFTSQTGDFAAVSLNATGEYNGLTFTGTDGVWTSTWTENHQRLVFNTNTGDLIVVPEPSTYAMVLAGLACSSWQMWRRRRLRQAPTLAA
jgi:fibronectin-binding autotransporter adhesin